MNLARLVKTRHVVLSSAFEPLDDETEQPLTRPLVPMLSETVTVPCSSLLIADDG